MMAPWASSGFTLGRRAGRFLNQFFPPDAASAWADDALGLLHDGLEVGGSLEALGIDFVDVFGAGGPGGEPAVGGDHLQAADGSVVARSARSAWP